MQYVGVLHTAVATQKSTGGRLLCASIESPNIRALQLQSVKYKQSILY